MLSLHCHIAIAAPEGKKSLALDLVHSVEIESSWRKLTDTAKITLPRKVRVLDGDINDAVRRGSSVRIWLGYDGNLRLEYVGYVARVDARVPFTVECEDEMWKLKQSTFSRTYRNASIRGITELVWEGRTNVVDFEIGEYRIDRATGAAVLDDLQKNYNVHSYFTYDNEPVLNVSLGGYDFAKKGRRHAYNLMANVVANDLVYRRKEENKVRVVATSTGKGGVVVRTETGDPDGEEVKLEKRNMALPELERLAQAELLRLQYDGYKGTLTGFGEPCAEHNDIAVVTDPEWPERQGAYMVDGVKKTFGTSGYRRQLALGAKLN